MARVRGDLPEPEITPADPDDVLGTEPTPGSDVTDVDPISEPDELDEDGEPDEREDDDGEPFISEGVRQELLTSPSGTVVDPMTGGVFRRDEDSGSVTFTPKRRNRPAPVADEPEGRPVTVKTDGI